MGARVRVALAALASSVLFRLSHESTMSKQKILDEIRRTAAANDGVPLGLDRFAAETGITEAAWRGRYWRRWNDAVREAGFTPNTRPEKTDQDVLLAHLGAFVRELGRYPTVAEMRMRKRQDDGFPNHKVFERSGSRPQLIARLLSYCERTPGSSDVAAISQSMAATMPEAVESGEPTREQDGWVYLALMRMGREKRFSY
jgi:hypothetical protein